MGNRLSLNGRRRECTPRLSVALMPQKSPVPQPRSAVLTPAVTSSGVIPIQRQTIASMTVAALRERILRGDFPDGEPLRQDALADELGVSRIPVREALRRSEERR